MGNTRRIRIDINFERALKINSKNRRGQSSNLLVINKKASFDFHLWIEEAAKNTCGLSIFTDG